MVDDGMSRKSPGTSGSQKRVSALFTAFVDF